MTEKYTIESEVDDKGRALIKRADGKTAYAKASWFIKQGNYYVLKRKTTALRLMFLDWL